MCSLSIFSTQSLERADSVIIREYISLNHTLKDFIALERFTYSFV